jgi:hypothetical protein
MVFLNINPKNYDVKGDNGKTKIDELNDLISNPNNKLFILFYMEGCGPCNATRPEWKKIENILKKKYSDNNNIVVAEVDQELISKIPLLKKQPSGFPAMYYIKDKGNLQEDYEESSIEKKDRSIDSFIEWIESKIPLKGGKKTKSIKYSIKKNVSKNNKNKNKKGGKWSLKYKKSINCSRPKGFSQKQYCKYSRKKRKSI